MKKYQNNVNIPVVYDTIREIDGHQMLRCSYFTVQTDEPIPNWNLDLGSESFPILLLNLEAIIIGSPKSPDMFRTPLDIDDMYALIEETAGLFVDINDIWISHSLFKFKEFKSGSVFRLDRELFTYCWKYRNDQISISELIENEIILSSKEREQSLVYYSEEESDAFKNWTSMQIQQSQELYRQNDSKLKKIK